MTETPERGDAPATGPIDTLPPLPPPAPVVVNDRPNRLYQVAAWVAIVAGTLFIVATIFFAGFFIGRHSGGCHHHKGADKSQHHRPPMGSWPPGPGFGPGFGMGPGGPGAPNQNPAPTSAPPRP